MPKAFKHGILILIVVAMIPPTLVARARAVRSAKTRIHLVQDMDNQPKFRAQHANPLFADGRAMRPPVAGTVAREQLDTDEHFHLGIFNGEWATTFPAQTPLTLHLVKRGRERFNIYCQPCHGAAGHGDGMVNKRAMELVNLNINGTTWVQPKSLHESQIREQPIGQVFNTITNGVRNMAGYQSQIPVADRWAIVAYVRVLQRSQNARIEDVGVQQRSSLQRRKGG